MTLLRRVERETLRSPTTLLPRIVDLMDNIDNGTENVCGPTLEPAGLEVEREAAPPVQL